MIIWKKKILKLNYADKNVKQFYYVTLLNSCFFLCKIFLFHFSKHYFVVSDEFVHILLSGMCGSADDWYNSNRRCRRLAQITCHV